jgi:hypothetical protein
MRERRQQSMIVLVMCCPLVNAVEKMFALYVSCIEARLANAFLFWFFVKTVSETMLLTVITNSPMHN